MHLTIQDTLIIRQDHNNATFSWAYPQRILFSNPNIYHILVTPSVSKYKMFWTICFPSVSRHVLVQDSNEPCIKICLDTDGKQTVQNILYFDTEGVYV